VADRAAEESGWTELNAAHLQRLRAGIGGAPLVELPFLFAEEFDRTSVDRLSQVLEVALVGRTGGAARRTS
jgi:hypothetical protein